MNLRNKTCPKCKKNKVKSFYAKRCNECYQSSRKKWFCADCSKEVDSGVNRCRACNSSYQSGENNPTWKGGLPRCIECRGTLSRYDSLKKTSGLCQKCYKGDKTRRWNPKLTQEFRVQGRSVNPEYYKWRNEIFNRDNYTCQICKDDRGGNLIAHHLDSFAIAEKLRTDIHNGITLCKMCHKNFHKMYGYLDNTKQQFYKFTG